MKNVTRFLTRRLKLKVKWGQKCGGSTGRAEVLRVQLQQQQRAETAHLAEGFVALQAEDPGTDATDARDQSGADDEGTNRLLKGLEELLRLLSNASVLKILDKWIRHRLRSMIWKQWKRGKQRYAMLRHLGVGRDLAAQTAGSPHRPWRLAHSPALQYAFPIAYFDSLGLPRLFDGFA
jgi:RNA-directed DNA polymerase